MNTALRKIQTDAQADVEHTQRHIHIEDPCPQSPGTPTFPPPTQESIRGVHFARIRDPQATPAHGFPPIPLLPGLAFVNFLLPSIHHPASLLVQVWRRSWEGEGRSISESFFCPTAKWGPRECSQRLAAPQQLLLDCLIETISLLKSQRVITWEKRKGKPWYSKTSRRHCREYGMPGLWSRLKRVTRPEQGQPPSLPVRSHWRIFFRQPRVDF